MQKDWAGGLVTRISGGYALNRHVGNFAAFSEPRRDRVTSLGLALRHNRVVIFGAVPELSYTFTRSSSNVGFFDFDGGDIGLRLTHEFQGARWKGEEVRG